MKRLITLLAITGIIFLQTVPGFCAVSRTVTFQISVTIPAHVMQNKDLTATPFSKNAYQLVQTETVVRNNQSISLTSIVVP